MGLEVVDGRLDRRPAWSARVGRSADLVERVGMVEVELGAFGRRRFVGIPVIGASCDRYAIRSNPTRSRIFSATVVLPEPEPPATPIVMGFMWAIPFKPPAQVGPVSCLLGWQPRGRSVGDGASAGSAADGSNCPNPASTANRAVALLHRDGPWRGCGIMARLPACRRPGWPRLRWSSTRGQAKCHAGQTSSAARPTQSIPADRPRPGWRDDLAAITVTSSIASIASTSTSRVKTGVGPSA